MLRAHTFHTDTERYTERCTDDPCQWRPRRVPSDSIALISRGSEAYVHLGVPVWSLEQTL
jgi:hypothetical protein